MASELISSSSSISQVDCEVHCGIHAKNVVRKMMDYYDNRQFYDVILVSGEDGKRFWTNRMVLSASSSYFEAMFAGSFQESKKQEIELVNVHSEPLEVLIRFSYTSEIKLAEGTVERLLETANLLQFTSVVVICGNFMAKLLNPSNCLQMHAIAEMYNCNELLSASISYMHQQFLQVYKSEEFLHLHANKLAILLKSDNLRVQSEEDVFFALQRWIQYDSETRKANLSELLCTVRLPLIEPKFIIDNVKSLCSSSNCQHLLIEALEWHSASTKKRDEMKSERTKERKSVFEGLSLSVIVSEASGVSIRNLNFSSNKWSIIKKFDEHLSSFGVAILDNKLFIIGGANNVEALPTVNFVDLKTLTWNPLNSMQTPRRNVATAVLQGYIYAIGGINEEDLSSVERWSPITNEWEYVASMTDGYADHYAAVLNNRIYVYHNREVKFYDPVRDVWTSCSPMRRRRLDCGVGVLNGMLYVMGGSDGDFLSSVERYDPASDSWTMMASLSVGRECITVGAIGNTLFAIGGSGRSIQGADIIVEKYQEKVNKWIKCPPLDHSAVEGYFNVEAVFEANFN